MQKSFILLLFIASFVFAQVKFPVKTLDEAQKLARTENKKILIDFYTDWCMPCKDLDKYIFGDSTISKFINEYYICLKINAEKDYGKKIGKELNLQEMYPTVILLTSDKKEIDRLTGLCPQEDYFQKIKDYTNNINTFDDLLKKEKGLKEQLAIKYFERGDLTKAIEHYLPLIEEEAFNSDGRIYFKIAGWYSLLKNIEKSKEYAIKAVNKNPSEKYYKKFLEELNSK